ncbi:hypothetical protein LPJ75_002725 [Coemansia sp. RSA 2598]|nr:hypothetical protein LPJ75_002725 [Coemansia sp. RSA 2598]
MGAANAADIARMDGHGSGGSANNVTFAPDPLIQQLLRGAADISNSNSAGAGAGASGKADGSGKGAFPNAAQSAWLSNALDSAMLPQWNSSDSPSGALSLSASGSTKTPSGKGSGKRGSISGGAGSRSVGKTPRQGSRVSGQSTSGAAAESGSGQRPSAHPVQLQQLLLGDIGTPSRRNSLKSARKRLKKKSASASIAKALSAAAMIDMDGLMSTDSNVMDTEMTGLYQDALQEGEELDVQEESLMADNSEYLFSSDQMRELRDQQIQNFQIVTQALLVSCAEVGPHAQRTRHWKQQLDQLALWHLLGTRESPSDLVSSEGLCHFATLIDSAEKVCEQSGSTAMTEMGRFAPNPTSFFAIPGITAVIPDLYEAIDEIHRATQLSVAEHETKAFGGGGSSGSTELKTIAASDGAVPAPPGQSSSLTAGASASVATGAGGSGLSVASSKAPEVRAFNGSMGFTTRCQCTPANGFKSAMMVQCVFPLLYLQMRNGADGSSGKRKASEVIEAADGRHYPSVASGVSGGGIGGGSSKKQQAVAPLSEDSATAAATATLSAGDGSSGLLQPAGVKPLKPLVKPISRQLSGSLLKGREASCGAGLPAIMPLISMENLPSYTAGDVRAVVDEMRAQVRAFKRDLHRVARSRRRIFVQGDDGVPRLEWMQVKIEPLTLPLAMQCLLAPLIEHSGFRESMMPKIVVVRKPKNRIHFLDTEDTLLLKGLRLFGLEDVASIRVHLMPCKTASQLRNRINNLRARRAEANPIKDFCLRRIMPFTLEEEEVLRLGVIVYGDEFNELNQNFLVNRPILALSHVWNHMRNSETSG